MWQCYDKLETPKIQSAFLIKRLPKEEIRKLIDNGKFICPKCKEQLTFVQEFVKEKGIVRSHFSHKQASNCKDWIPEGESEKHYNLKFSLLDQLTNDTIKIKIGNLIFDSETNDHNIIFADTEIKAIVERRADILLQLKTPNALFGLGIAIEIMVSEEYNSIYAKSKDYASKGYSVAITTDGESIEVIQVYPKIILELFEYNFNKLKQQEELIKSIDSSFLVRANKYGWDCTTCAKAKKDNAVEGFIVCFKDYDYTNRTGEVIKKADIVPCPKYYPSNKPKILLAEPDLEVECNRVVE